MGEMCEGDFKRKPGDLCQGGKLAAAIKSALPKHTPWGGGKNGLGKAVSPWEVVSPVGSAYRCRSEGAGTLNQSS